MLFHARILPSQQNSSIAICAADGGMEIYMDIQLKRGILDVCVLAAIKDEASYGYEIIKDMKPYTEMSESTLYTILKRLETANMLTIRTAEHNGRLRKYYRITPGGLARIEDFKREWGEILCIYKFIAGEVEQNEEK